MSSWSAYCLQCNLWSVWSELDLPTCSFCHQYCVRATDTCRQCGESSEEPLFTGWCAVCSKLPSRL